MHMLQDFLPKSAAPSSSAPSSSQTDGDVITTPLPDIVTKPTLEGGSSLSSLSSARNTPQIHPAGSSPPFVSPLPSPSSALAFHSYPNKAAQSKSNLTLLSTATTSSVGDTYVLDEAPFPASQAILLSALPRARSDPFTLNHALNDVTSSSNSCPFCLNQLLTSYLPPSTSPISGVDTAAGLIGGGLPLVRMCTKCFLSGENLAHAELHHDAVSQVAPAAPSSVMAVDEKTVQPVFPEAAYSVDPLLWDLLTSCLKPNPSSRPSASEILNHPYFASIHRAHLRDQYRFEAAQTVVQKDELTTATAFPLRKKLEQASGGGVWVPISTACSITELSRRVYRRAQAMSSDGTSNGSCATTTQTLVAAPVSCQEENSLNNPERASLSPQTDNLGTASIIVAGSLATVPAASKPFLETLPVDVPVEPGIPLLPVRLIGVSVLAKEAALPEKKTTGGGDGSADRRWFWTLEEVYWLWLQLGGNIEAELAQANKLTVLPAIKRMPVLVYTHLDDGGSYRQFHTDPDSASATTAMSNQSTPASSPLFPPSNSFPSPIHTRPVSSPSALPMTMAHKGSALDRYDRHIVCVPLLRVVFAIRKAAGEAEYFGYEGNAAGDDWSVTSRPPKFADAIAQGSFYSQLLFFFSLYYTCNLVSALLKSILSFRRYHELLSFYPATTCEVIHFSARAQLLSLGMHLYQRILALSPNASLSNGKGFRFVVYLCVFLSCIYLC